MASSSNPSPPNFTHDVFVSYMHADTGSGFTSHLKSAFYRAGFDVAMNDTVDKGEEISDTVLSNISESLVCVVVFSKSYATSIQCLDELVKIWERKEENGGRVLPVFLGVEPTHVRNQTGAFGDGFQRLIKSINQFKEKEETWKSALTKTANLSGWDSTVKSEAEILEAIVECIEKTLDQLPSKNYSDDFVGIYQVKAVESLLQLQSRTNVQFLGIWGMGGIGKTRISKELFNQISSLFDASCFLENVKETLKRKGLESLKKKMYSKLGIDFKSSLPLYAQRALSRKRVFIILDDVSEDTQFMSFVKSLHYGSGSRMILTCRDKHVLNNYQCEVYKVQTLNRCESLKLFKFHAFKGQLCHELYEALLNEALLYCGGLPLALELLGSNLCDKNLQEWESELAKLKNIPNRGVNDIIKISYEGLDGNEKSIFLDIACMFYGWNETKVKGILHASFPDSGIRWLTDKALITNSNGILRMHDLIQQFGQHMVFSESKEPGNRSRLWRFEDFSHVVAQNTGSEKVEIISVDLNEGRRNMSMMAEFFDKMTYLRVFNLYHGRVSGIRYSDDRCIIQVPEGLSSLPSTDISYLRWDNFPLTSFPQNFGRADHLVELRLSHSRLKQLGSDGAEEPHLPLLECVDLSGSKDLIKLPNLSKCLNLKTLDVRRCGALVEVPSSIQHLSKLQTLCMGDCINLAKLLVLPQSIVSLELNGTNIKELPSWIGSLSQLECLYLEGCKNLKSLPDLPSRLEILDAGGCPYLRIEGDIFGSSLRELYLGRSGVESLPASIKHLSQLKKLYLSGCKSLKSLPDLPSSLEELNAGGCTSLRIEGDIFGSSLRELYLGRSGVESLPASIKHLSQLKKLDLVECKNLKSLPDLPSSLEKLDARGCTSLRIEGDIFGSSLSRLDLGRSGVESLPASIKHLSQLRKLDLVECKNLKSLPDLPSSLQELDASGCTSLTTVGNIFGKCDGGSCKFNMGGCFNLDQSSRIICLANAQATLNARNYEALLPGSEVPDWFKYKVEGSSIEVELLGGMLLEHLNKLAFCVVVDDPSNTMEISPGSPWLYVTCDMFVRGFGQHVFYSSLGYDFIRDTRGNSKSVFLWAGSVEATGSSMMCSKAKFQFEAHYVDNLWVNRSKCKIMHCGLTFQEIGKPDARGWSRGRCWSERWRSPP